MRRGVAALAGAALLAVATPAAGAPTASAAWTPFRHVVQVVAVAAPGADGAMVLAADGRLARLGADGRVVPFARGRHGYTTTRGTEPYLTRTMDQPVAGAPCRFPRDGLAAIEPSSPHGVVAIDGTGRARRLASLPSADTPNGIVYDDVGSFGHHLLVTAGHPSGASVYEIDCRGRVRTLTTRAPAVEGGLAVAPPGFGSAGGDLVAPDETAGRVIAVTPDGTATTLVDSGLPAGGDVGVESAGFAPPGFDATWAAYLADRSVPGNAHPGDDAVLRLPGRDLVAAGVRAGDLLVATEGGARMIRVRCTPTCTAVEVASGPPVAHGEGHLVLAPG